jgi:hypothetical protein
MPIPPSQKRTGFKGVRRSTPYYAIPQDGRRAR